MKRAAIIVLDGVGIGAAPDASAYGDAGSNTLGNTARAVGGMLLPNLERAGLGNIADIDGVLPAEHPLAAWSLLQPRSAGKDSTTGHWEIAGVCLSHAFPTYPAGFPHSVVDEFARRTKRSIIGNVVASGTDVIARFGPEHECTGAWILYTSADSVFQVAAHERVISLDELYAACEIARELLVPPHDVSRVIARPFIGTVGCYTRTSHRRDFSIPPPEMTLLDALAEAHIPRHGIAKVDDLFAGRSVQSTHTASNAEGLRAIREWLATADSGLLFANLIDFDQLFGHRNDVPGFCDALREFDAQLPNLLCLLREDDLLFITADHGNDPTTASTDHAREYVPLLVFGSVVRPISLGCRDTFGDVGATVSEWFGLDFRGCGRSFLTEAVRAR